jgi:dihydroxy-acid dehydratase
MKKGLRSRLAQYGDEEFALFLRRGFLKGAGFTDEALDRPIVGILSTASDFNPCHKTAPQVAEAISRGVRMAGALPFVFPTVSLHEAFSYPTSMLLRNLMAMDVEEMIKALPLDAVVLIGGCDKTIPAELMGAISADMPAIIVNVGSMLAGKHEGTRLGACTDCRRLWAQFRAGTLDGPDLNRAHDQLMPTSGTCMVMGTASTMACMAETLGFMLPGSATAPAVSSDRWRFAEATGKRAAEMAKTGGPKPSELLTKSALKNASVVLQATSGSTNAIVHLAAIAGRAGITYDLQELDRVGRDVPVLLDLKPATFPPSNTDKKCIRAAAAGKACGFRIQKKPLLGVSNFIERVGYEQSQGTEVGRISRRLGAPAAHGKILSVLIRLWSGSQGLGQPGGIIRDRFRAEG